MATERYNDLDLITALQKVSSSVGGSLSVAKYEQLRSVDQPSAARIIQRFGSWNKAVAAAGTKLTRTTRVYKSKFQTNDVTNWARKYFAQATKPSYQDFSTWLKTQSDAPSAQTCRNLVGSWQAIVNLVKN